MNTLNIIHIDSRQDRRISFMRQAIQHRVKITVWPGIVVPGKPFTGISQAYKQVVQYAKEQGWEYAIIADDDFLFTSPNSWQYFLDNIPDDFDLYSGGISGGVVDEQTKTIEQWSGTFFFAVHSRFYDAFLAANEDRNIDRWLGNKVDYNGATAEGYLEIKKLLGREPVYKICYPMPVICIDGISDNGTDKDGGPKYMDHKNYFAPYKLLK